MGGLNKEKIVALLCLLPLVLAIYSGVQAIRRTSSWQPSFQEPAPSHRGATSATPKIRFFEFPTRGRAPRDPFETLSEWRRAEPDPLPVPPFEALSRRVPLPGPLVDSSIARLPRESKMPEPIEEND